MSSSLPKLRRAVILAAGKSERLSGLRLNKPKPLIEVAGKPLLAHHLERCAAQGIDEVFINLHHLPEQIRAFAGDGSRWKIKITYQEETELLGTAGAVKNFAEDLRGEPFLVIYGDNFCTFSLSELIQAHFRRSPQPDMSIVLFELENISGSGVAICDQEDLIQSFIEKPAAGTTLSHWVNAGVYIMEPHLLDAIPGGVSDFGRDVIPALLASGKRILGVKTQGRVYAIDTPELLQRTTATQSPG
jgi:NDP-sugar pyrophosphorylase family protein